MYIEKHVSHFVPITECIVVLFLKKESSEMKETSVRENQEEGHTLFSIDILAIRSLKMS